MNANINEHELTKKLESEGFTNVVPCDLAPNHDPGEHTHDEDTVHIIESGELIIIDPSGTRSYVPGDRVEFSAGTKHIAHVGPEGCRMIVGVRG
jgi:hypothetical protein